MGNRCPDSLVESGRCRQQLAVRLECRQVKHFLLSYVGSALVPSYRSARVDGKQHRSSQLAVCRSQSVTDVQYLARYLLVGQGQYPARHIVDVHELAFGVWRAPQLDLLVAALLGVPEVSDPGSQQVRAAWFILVARPVEVWHHEVVVPDAPADPCQRRDVEQGEARQGVANHLGVEQLRVAVEHRLAQRLVGNGIARCCTDGHDSGNLIHLGELEKPLVHLNVCAPNRLTIQMCGLESGVVITAVDQAISLVFESRQGCVAHQITGIATQNRQAARLRNALDGAGQEAVGSNDRFHVHLRDVKDRAICIANISYIVKSTLIGYYRFMYANKPLAETSTTVDVVIFSIQDDDLKVLLVKRSGDPYKDAWALPGGFLWQGETTGVAASRILSDKAGVSNVFIEQLYTFDEPDRDPRGHIITVAYFALVPEGQLKPRADHELQEPTLFSVKDLPELAFDHQQIIAYALKRLQSKLIYTNVAYSLSPQQFTLSQLQRLYEVILDKPLDKRNFRKKYLSLGLIVPTDESVTGIRQRPAQLYKFSARKLAILQKTL